MDLAKMTKGIVKHRSSEKLLLLNRVNESELLKSSSEVLQLIDSLLDAMVDPVVLLDSSGRILASNKSWLGFQRQWVREEVQTYGQLIAEIFKEAPEDEKILKIGVEVLQNKGASEFQHDFCVSSNEGRRHWIRFRATPVSFLEALGVLMLTHQDVSHLHRAEQDFRESYNLFRRLIESIKEGVFLYDTDGRFVMANTAFAESLGRSVAELLGKEPMEIFPHELASTIHEQNMLVRTTGHTLSFELMHRFPDGEVRNLQLSKGIYRNHRNEFAGIFGIARVLSNHEKIDETVEKSERHFRALIENSADRVSLLWPDGRIRYASPSSKRILGFDIDELINVDLFQRVHPQDVDELKRIFYDLRQRPGFSINHHYRALRKDGRWQWMEATMTNLLNDPSVGAVVVNERDISERKEAENHLRRYADLIKSSHDAIISTDIDGIVTSWNPAAERIFGYTQREIVGKSLKLLFSEESEILHQRLRMAALRGKGADSIEAVLIRKDERLVDVSITISPISDRERRVIGVSKIIRDITDRRCLEREILEISDREKERIGQDLHDDLCQHLIGISLVSDRIAKELEKAEHCHAKGVRDVTELVRSAVDHARQLARGLSLVQLEEIGLEESLNRLVQNTELIFRVPCSLECESTAIVNNVDTAKALFRIAQEALHNAVKHSQGTRIIISLKALRDTLVISVIDDGVGMPEHRSSVKESPDTPESGGFGLHGMLYRARSIGATLEFRKNREGGTTVVCRIPKRKCL